MKSIFIFFACLSVSFSFYGQNSASLQDQYDQIFLLEKKKFGDREVLITTVNTLEEGKELADLVNNNKLYLDYLLSNFSDRGNFTELMALEDQLRLQKEFIHSLEEDTLFNATLYKISEKAEHPGFVPDTVSLDEVLNVAVKFFNIKHITEEGNYAGKVCAGINGITETLPQRKPHLEAFSFSTIFNDMKENENNMHDEFVEAIYELYKLDLGVEKDDRLLRAQGVMYSLMRNNEQLRELLLSSYEKKKHFVPFVISLDDSESNN